MQKNKYGLFQSGVEGPIQTWEGTAMQHIIDCVVGIADSNDNDSGQMVSFIYLAPGQNITEMR